MTRSDQLETSLTLRSAAVLIAVIGVLYLGRDLFIPLALAITLTLVLEPAATWMERLRLPRVPSALLVIAMSLAVAAGVGFVILNELIQVLDELPRYQENIHRKIQSIRAPTDGALGRAAESVKKLEDELSGVRAGPDQRAVPVQIVNGPGNELQYLRDLAKPSLTPIAELGVVLVFSLFLLIEAHDLRKRLFRLAGVERLNVVTKALDDATHRVSRYLLLQLVVNAGFGILCGLGLFLIGVPYAALWGTVAGISRIVPYAGSIVAGLLPFMLSLAAFDDWVHPFVVILLFGTLELITGNLLEPWLYGMHTGISSLALLLATAFWVILWGPMGLLLATPLTVCAVVLGSHIPQLSFLHILLGDQIELSIDAQIYQRLLAMDDRTVRSLSDEYMQGHSLVELYDSAVIPALAMAEQDRHKGALDPTREKFVFLSVREMLAEFSEQTSGAEESLDAQLDAQFPSMPPGRVLCLPASDEADEIVAAMLGQLLEHAGRPTLALPLDASLQHMLTLLEPGENDIFCVSSLPPFAFANAITMSRLLHTQFPRTRIIVGVWGFSGDEERALGRFQPARPERLVRSLEEALSFLVAGAPATETLSDRLLTPGD